MCSYMYGGKSGEEFFDIVNLKKCTGQFGEKLPGILIKMEKGKSHISVTQRGKKFMKKCSLLRTIIVYKGVV